MTEKIYKYNKNLLFWRFVNLFIAGGDFYFCAKLLPICQSLEQQQLIQKLLLFFVENEYKLSNYGQ